MSYRNNVSSPLVDLIQSYRNEQVVRDRMRMDGLQREQDNAFRISQANKEDARYKADKEDRIKMWAYGENEQKIAREHAMNNDDIRTGFLEERARQETTLFDRQITDRKNLDAAKQEVVDATNASANANVTALEGSLKQYKEQYGGFGKSGKSVGIEAVPDDNGDFTIMGVDAEGNKRGMSNVDPSNDDPAAAMKVAKADFDAVSEHVNGAMSFASQNGIKGAQLQAYARASVWQDPNTGYVRPATPEEMAQNLKTQGFLNAQKETARDKRVDKLAGAVGAVSDTVVSGWVTDAINTLDPEAKMDKAIASGVIYAWDGAEGVAKAFVPKMFQSEEQAGKLPPIYIAKSGEPVISPKATPEDVIKAKEEADEQGIPPTMEPFGTEQLLAFETKLAGIKGDARVNQAIGKLYMAGGLTIEQYENKMATGDFSTSPMQLAALSRQIAVSESTIRKNNAAAVASAAKYKKDMGLPANAPVYVQDAMKTDDGIKLYKNLENLAANAVEGAFVNTSKKQQQEQLGVVKGAVLAGLSELGVSTFKLDLTDANTRVAVATAAKRKASDLQAGRDYPMVTYLVNLTTSGQDKMGSFVSSFVASRNSGKPQLITFNGQTTVFDSAQTTTMFASYLKEMQGARDTAGIEGEMSDAEVARYFTEFQKEVQVQDR